MKFKEFTNNIFDWASVKLSASYVVIIMLISISFSISIFQLSRNEINQSLGGTGRALRDMQISQMFPDSTDQFETLRAQQIETSTQHLRLRLIYFNLLIFLASAIGSYFLARLTLKPIEESMEAQSRFTADASHELRTPLTAMKTEIEVALRDNKLNLTDSKKILGSSLEEIEKLELLSTSLLKLASHENSDQTKSEVPLEDAFVEAYEKVQTLAEKKKIEFTNKLLNLEIKGNRAAIVELFVILLDNAIKYSPNGSTIALLMEQVGHQKIVKIKDQGIGIKASDLPYIFNRFYRADTSRNKDKISGYGLGLSIAQKIAEAHNGKISVKSKPGKGSEFIVTFS